MQLFVSGFWSPAAETRGGTVAEETAAFAFFTHP